MGEMVQVSDRLKRWSILGPTAVLPKGLRVSSREYLLGRLEMTRALRARLIIIGHPKSGNTWLRALISRLFQVRHGLPSDFVVKTDELHQRNSEIPPLLATNGYYSYEGVIGRALAVDAPRCALHDANVLLLARHPCDIAVSWYIQFTRRQSAYKNELINACLTQPIDRNNVERWEFVRNSEIGLPFLIDFLNTWERNLRRVHNSRIVRYEDLRVDTAANLGRIVELMGETFSQEELQAAAEWGSFENMQKLETQGHFRSGGLAIMNGKGKDADTLKVRKGKVGGYRDYFTAEQVAELDELVRTRLSPTFGYHEPAMDYAAS